MSAAGGSVTGVEIHPDRADIEEVTEQTCTARIQLGGPSGTRHVTARLDLGLTLGVVSGAPVLIADAVMDRLAVPVPDGDALAPFREARPVRAEREQAVFVIDRRAGRVFQVSGGLPGQRPRFEPRNMDFGEGLDRWDLDFLARTWSKKPPPRSGTTTPPQRKAGPRSCPRRPRSREVRRCWLGRSSPTITAARPSRSAARSAPRTWPARPACGWRS